jgi:hypothetical protein
MPTNSPSVPKNWLRQAEQFLIWNDGINLPVIWDGNSARRSLGPSTSGAGLTSLATIAASDSNGDGWNPPPINQYISLLLNAPYTGPIGIPVLINTATYYLQSASTLSGASGLNYLVFGLVSGSGSDSIPVGSKFSLNNKICGAILSAVDGSGNSISNWPAIPSSTPPATLTCIVGGQLTEFAVSFGFDFRDYSTGKTHAHGIVDTVAFNSTTSQTTVTWRNPLSSSDQSATSTVNSIYYGGTTWFVVSWNLTNFPSIASTVILNYVTLTLTQSFRGNVGDTLQIGTALMTVTAINGAQVTCQMQTNGQQAIPFIASASTVPTTALLLMDNTASGSLTTVATYPATGPNGAQTDTTVTGLAGGAYCQPGSVVPAAGMVVQVTNPTTNVTDTLFITSSSGAAPGQTSYFVLLKNLNDTSSNTAGTAYSIAAGTPIYSLPELPVGNVLVYGMGRIWMALPDGQHFIGGDIVGAASGSNSPPTNYNFADAILKISQNFMLAGGTTFSIPGSGETICAMAFVQQLNVALGQGPLMVFTDDTVFSCQAPTDATTWSNLTSPILTEALLGSGGISDDDVSPCNADLIFRTSDGGIQSLQMATLAFVQWGNTPISKEVSRSIQNDDPTLLPFSKSIIFNNRRLTTCQFQQAARGVYGPAMVSLNFDPNSSLSGKAPSVWESEWNGLNVLEFIVGRFNGSIRCYALCLSADLSQIELHQIQLDDDGYLDDGVTPITMTAESPMLFPEKPNAAREYKRLANGEFSVKNIVADVDYSWWYRSDQNPNWTLWYSSTIKYQGVSDPGYRRRISIGMPDPKKFDATNNQPLREGYNFQVKLSFTGQATLTNARFAADIIPEPDFGTPK